MIQEIGAALALSWNNFANAFVAFDADAPKFVSMLLETFAP